MVKRMSRRSLVASLVGIAAFAVGCQQAAPAPAPPKEAPSAPKPQATAPPAAAAPKPAPAQATAPAPAAAAKPAKPKDTLKLVLARGGEGVQQAPEYIARARSFFAEEGVEVEHLQLLGPEAVAATLRGDADLTAGFSYVLSTHAKGQQDLAAFATVFNQYAAIYVLANDAYARIGINPQMNWEEKVRRLKGLRLGVSGAGSTIDILTRVLLTGQKIDPEKDVSLVYHGGATAGTALMAALERGEVDGFAYASPFPEQVEKRGKGKIFLNVTSGEVPLTDGYLFVTYLSTKKKLADKREAFIRFTRAMTRSLRFIDADRVGTVEVLKKALPTLDPDVVEKAFDNVRPAFPKDPRILPKNVQVNIAIQNLTDNTQLAFPFEQLVLADIAEQALK